MAHIRFQLSYIYSLLFLILPVFSLWSSQTILLREGGSLQGTITSQDAEGLTVQSKDGKRTNIPKSKLLKVIYREVEEAEIERIRKEEEEKLQKREREKLKQREERKRALEEKRKEFETQQKEELRAMEERLGKSKVQSQTSGKLKEQELGYMTQYRFSKVYSHADVKLASPTAKCKEHSRSSNWYWLFGTFRITKPDNSALFPKNGGSVRIRTDTTWMDVGISSVLGFLGTFTRRTIVVESCGGGSRTRLYTEEELKYELEKQKFQLQSQFMKEKEELLDLHKEN